MILDEVLGLVDNGIISVDDLKHMIESKSDDVSIIMTGIHIDDGICEVADEISKIEALNYKIF